MLDAALATGGTGRRPAPMESQDKEKQRLHHKPGSIHANDFH